MPFDGFTQEAYAQKMIDEYKAAGVPPRTCSPQSFNQDDVLYWVENEPAFGRQAVYLDDAETVARSAGVRGAGGLQGSTASGLSAPPMFALLSRWTRRTTSCHRSMRATPRPPASTSSPGRWSARVSWPTAPTTSTIRPSTPAISREGDVMKRARRAGARGRHPRHLLGLARDSDLLRQLRRRSLRLSHDGGHSGHTRCLCNMHIRRR